MYVYIRRGAIQLLVFDGHQYLSDVWLDVDLNTKQCICVKEIGSCAQNMLIILDSIVNLIHP